MMHPFNPRELISYIREEEHAGPLIERYVGASPLERHRILEDAKDLGRPPVILDFHFPETPTSESKTLCFFEGHSTARKKALTPRGEIKTQNIEIPQILAVDKKKRFEFTIEHKDGDNAAFITVCQVYKQHRRRGFFSLMVGVIQNYCFNELGVRTVLGNARPPRDESTQDWRTNLVTHNKIKITALHSLWLKQPYAVFGAMIGDDDPESFAFLNPALLEEFTKADFADWDKTMPHKPKKNTFVELMSRKEAA